MADNFYLPGAEPFFFQGGATGCVLVHGFMSSPGEMRWLGQFLHQQGLTCYGIRLTGHGTDYRQMAHIRWPEWVADVVDACTLLQQTCEQVFIVGHSMGGLLALLAGAVLPVDGLVIMASPVLFASRWIALSSMLKYITPFRDSMDRTHLPGLMREEQALRGEPLLGRIRYDMWSVTCLAELYAVSKAARARLPEITIPTCLIYSTADQTAPYDNMQLIASQIRSKVISQHTLHKSDHNLMLDEEKERVFQWTWDFVRSRKA
jgi:carboxylesterase